MNSGLQKQLEETTLRNAGGKLLNEIQYQQKLASLPPEQRKQFQLLEAVQNLHLLLM